MKPASELVEDLSSSDSAIRDRAALDLKDLGDPCAVEPLISAILAPENENYRGTLVYALSSFDCGEHLPLIVDLFLIGNYEVASGAYTILKEASLSSSDREYITGKLKQFDAGQAKYEHSSDSVDFLRYLVGNMGPDRSGDYA